MTHVEFTIDRQLPNVCMVCGDYASPCVRRFIDAHYRMSANEVLKTSILGTVIGGMAAIFGIATGGILPGEIFNGLFAKYQTTKVHLYLPLCDRHFDYFGFRTLMFFTWIAIAIISIVMVAITSIRSGEPLFQDVFSASLIIAAVFWFVSLTYFRFRVIRLTRNYSGMFTLHNVCDQFSSALQRQRIADVTISSPAVNRMDQVEGIS